MSLFVCGCAIDANRCSMPDYSQNCLNEAMVNCLPFFCYKDLSYSEYANDVFLEEILNLLGND